MQYIIKYSADGKKRPGEREYQPAREAYLLSGVSVALVSVFQGQCSIEIQAGNLCLRVL